MGNPWFFSVHLSFGTSVQKLHHRPFTNFTIFQGRAVAHGINCSPPFPCYLYIQWDKQTNPHGFSSVPKNLPRLDRPKKDPNRFDFDACHGLQLIMIPMIFRFFKKYGKMWRKIWHQSRILGIWKTCDVFFLPFSCPNGWVGHFSSHGVFIWAARIASNPATRLWDLQGLGHEDDIARGRSTGFFDVSGWMVGIRFGLP